MVKRRLNNVVSTSFDHDVPTGNVKNKNKKIKYKYINVSTLHLFYIYYPLNTNPIKTENFSWLAARRRIWA